MLPSSSFSVSVLVLAFTLLVRCNAEREEMFTEHNTHSHVIETGTKKSIIGTTSYVLESTVGTNYPTIGTALTFPDLDTAMYTYSLTVEVYETDFLASSEYVNGIYAGLTVLSSYCDPGVDNGGSYYTCVTDQDVTADVTANMLNVLTTATNDVDCCGYNGYYLYVRYTLTGTENTDTTNDGVWEGGTNDPVTGVSYTYTNLDTTLYAYTLTVEVYETDFDYYDEYVDGIHSGSKTLSSHCDPGVNTGGSYYTCVTAQDVTADVTANTLTVLTTATFRVDCCGYNSYFLYVKYTLTPTPHTSTIVAEQSTDYPATGVSYMFTNLDTSLYFYSLTVEVFESNYEYSQEYVNNILSGSRVLSSNCDPNENPMGSYFQCIQKVDVTDDIDMMSNSLTVLTTATSDYSDCCAYGSTGYYLKVKYILSLTSTNTVWEGGTDLVTNGISHTFTNVDTSLYIYTLSVEVYETDFEETTEYIDGIYAGSTVLSSYCDPDVDNGGSYYTCVTDQDVTADVTANTLTVLTTATDNVNYYPYNEYYLYVRYTLIAIENPGYVNAVQVEEAGTNSPTMGLMAFFFGLDTSTYRYFIMAEVYETDFDLSSEYVDNILVEGSTLSTFCDPGIDNGNRFFICLPSQEVTNMVTSGALTMSATATSAVNSYPYQGYDFYMRFTLSREYANFENGIWEGGTNDPVTGVSHTYTNLDTALYTYTLTVEVYETDFSSGYEYIDVIYAGTTMVSNHCDPGIDDGGSFYTCVTSQDVTSDVRNMALTVETRATVDVDSNAYQGYVLYMKYSLTSTLIIDDNNNNNDNDNDNSESDNTSLIVPILVPLIMVSIFIAAWVYQYHRKKLQKYKARDASRNHNNANSVEITGAGAGTGTSSGGATLSPMAAMVGGGMMQTSPQHPQQQQQQQQHSQQYQQHSPPAFAYGTTAHSHSQSTSEPPPPAYSQHSPHSMPIVKGHIVSPAASMGQQGQQGLGAYSYPPPLTQTVAYAQPTTTASTTTHTATHAPVISIDTSAFVSTAPTPPPTSPPTAPPTPPPPQYTSRYHEEDPPPPPPTTTTTTPSAPPPPPQQQKYHEEDGPY